MAAIETEDMHVLIVGAGITGLLLAQSLKQSSIPFTIFESESPQTHRAITEWSIGIHWCLPRLESLMGPLWPRLPEAKNNRFYPEKANDAMPLLNAATGEKVRDIPLGRIVRVSRQKMRALCKEGIDVMYGKEVVGVKYGDGGKGVSLSFADGEAATGTLLVGADGPHSKVRELLLGAEAAKATPLPVAMLRAHVCYHDVEKIQYILDNTHPIFSVGYHPDGIVLFNTISDVSDETRQEDWVLQVTCTWLDDGDKGKSLSSEERLKMVKGKCKGMGGVYGKIWEWIPDGTFVSASGLSYWVTKPWDNHGGRVTLAGDAAHPLPPHRGQGLNNCVEDVWNLVEELKKIKTAHKSVIDALDIYDRELVERGSKEVQSSVDDAIAAHDWKMFTGSAIYSKGLKKE